MTINETNSQIKMSPKKNKKKKNKTISSNTEITEEPLDNSNSLENSEEIKSEKIVKKKKKSKKKEDENISNLEDEFSKNKKRHISESENNDKLSKKAKNDDSDLNVSCDLNISCDLNCSNIYDIKIKKKKDKKSKKESLILNNDTNMSSDNENILPVNNSVNNTEDDELNDSKTKIKKKKTKVEYRPEEWQPLSPSPDKKLQSISSETSTSKIQKQSTKTKSEIKEMVEEDIDESEIKDLVFGRKKPKWSKKEKRKLSKKNNQNILEGEPHIYTTSIAIPASILEETCLLLELRTYVVGQLARVACIYSVDEIIVFNDGPEDDSRNDEFMGMMKMILEYQECPQYLRKALFPYHRFMSKAGVLSPLNATHHLLSNEWCPYREGVVEETKGPRSTVNVGLRVPVVIDRPLESGVRVTVKFPPETKSMSKPYGILVSPEEPRLKGGLYWGYTVRVAHSISEVFEGDRFPKYDLLIGTSDKGKDVNSIEKFPHFTNALIVFGGVKGLESGFKLDSKLSKREPSKYFDHYLNICPNQQSRTIRTEEAVTMTLARISDMLSIAGKEEL